MLLTINTRELWFYITPNKAISITSTQNAFTLARLQQALAKILKTPQCEREICHKISEKHLLHLARRHEQDSLGVEIMSYVFEIVESYVGSKNLIITRENASSLENMTSYKPFDRSDARGFYDYDFKGRINKIDGLFRLQTKLNGENVYTWLLNLEVDGQDKT